MTAQEARQLGPLARFFVEPAAVAPGILIKKEIAYATGAGAGAGLGNEAAGNPQQGDNFWSDFLGSLTGVGATGLSGKITGTLKNVGATVMNKPDMVDEIVGQEVADRVINNSTTLAQQFDETGSNDLKALADTLRQPSAIEEAIPGYQANIGDRSQDPGLATFAYNTDAIRPGAANSRRTANETAVNTRMSELDPGGDPSQFRSALSNSRDTQIAGAQNDALAAEGDFARSIASLQPAMTGEGRGANIRAALADVSEQAREFVRQAWEPLNRSNHTVPVDPLAEVFEDLNINMSLAERRRFRPVEADMPVQLVERSESTGGRGQPVLEITGLRSALTDAAREAAANGSAAEARIINQHVNALDAFMANNIPAELRGQYDEARAVRRDFADRFERPGDAIADVLRTREGGDYRQPDSAVAPRFVQSDEGRLSDFEAIMREAGSDPRVRSGLRDEVLSDVSGRGMLEDPERLEDYIGGHGTLLNEFPELRGELTNAAGTRRRATETRERAQATERDLTTPGRSPIASYLQYGDERAVDAIRTVVNAAQPREATRALIQAAGGTPEALANARTALWADIEQTGRMDAPGITGEDRWNGKKLRRYLQDTKRRAVAEELYADAPEELADIETVFEALATAEGSARARAPSTSGTAQALAGKFDPSLSAASVASRMRSVNRGVLSPNIMVIDLAASWLRGRTAQFQARAIDTLASSVVNNPGLAADLLERFNPADYAAKRRMISQKYGMRASQLLNLLDEMQEPEDPVMDAITGGE